MNSETTPKVSVIMGVYNGEKYLSSAVESILNQTFKDFEFIIINDGSTDNTKKILESYSDPRIRLFNQTNIGLTKTLNRGLQKSRGEYIARQDADDISNCLRLERQLECLEKNPSLSLVGTHVGFIDGNNKRFSVWHPPEDHENIVTALKKYNCFCHGSVVFKKVCVDKVGGYRDFFTYTQDYDLWCRIVEGYKTMNLPEVLYEFRKEAGTISRKKLSKQLEYHLLTILLSQDRVQKGKERYIDMTDKNPLHVLKYYYGLKSKEINKFKSGHYMNYFEAAMMSKEFIYAFSLWVRCFLMYPEIKKIKQLLYSALDLF